MSAQDGYPLAGLSDSTNEYKALLFAIGSILSQVQTATLVKVTSVTNAGGVAAVGYVDVQPIVNQMTAQRVGVEHGTLHNVPYLRLQGGANAVILDPQVGDIGICVFASRDISAVKVNKDVSNPGSYRQFDWADGLYLGGVLNDTPTQYVRFSTDGIELHSATKVTLHAPTVAVEGDLTVSGTTTGTGDGVFAGIDVQTHTHPGVTSGGSNTGPPV